jgi:hypothetical protein
MFMVAAGVMLIYSTLRLLIKRKMTETNSILWFLIGLVTILAGCCPKIVVYLASILRIEYSPALVFTVAILILLLIVFKNTVTISELIDQVQELAIELSVVEEELNRLRKETKMIESDRQGMERADDVKEENV